jgi:hypothetical protein
MKKIAIGHHIGERAHVLEREQNLRSGEREERQEFINLEEGELNINVQPKHSVFYVRCREKTADFLKYSYRMTSGML